MDLRQLEVFEAIMRSGSVSAAARELGLTQSAVSRILARFEDDLGFSLFVRANGRLRPTNQSNAVLSQARGILESVSALQSMSSHSEFMAREMSFVTVPSLSYGLIPTVLSAFASEQPDVRFRFDVRTTEAAVDAMVRREAQFAIVALPVSHPTLHVTPLFRTVSCAVMHREHRLADKEEIKPEDIVGEKMIFLLRRQPTRQLIEDAFLRAGYKPDIQVETSNVATACRCAEKKLGIAIVNGMMAGYSETPDLVVKPFIPRIHHTVALIEQIGRERSESVTFFINCLTNEIYRKFASIGLPLEMLSGAHSEPEYGSSEIS